MTLRISDIKYPSSWNMIPSEIEYMDYSYEEALELGVWEKDNKRDKACHYEVTSFSRFYWFSRCFDGLLLGAELMVWFFKFDDAFDGGYIKDDEKQVTLINRMNNVFMEGKLEDDATGVEKIALLLRNKCKEICGDKRIDSFNRFILSCVQWVDSIVPFNKLKDNESSPHFEVYAYIRKFNVGALPCVALTDVMIGHELDQHLWFDPRWVKMNDIISIAGGVCNDICSYEKELIVEGGGPKLNTLRAIEVNNNLSLPDAYKKLCDQVNLIIQDYLRIRDSFLLSYQFDDEKKKNDLKLVIDAVEHMFSAALLWESYSTRYTSSTSPFIELRINFEKQQTKK